MQFTHIILRIVIFCLSALSVLTVKGDTKSTYYLSGMVRDKDTLEPLPFASVTVTGDAIGTLTNDNGIFELTVPNDAKELTVTCLGYDKAHVSIHKGTVNLYDVTLTPSVTQLNELVVRKPKYSKKNNPAVEFVKRLKECGDLSDPLRNQYYNYEKHDLLTVGINDFAEKKENSALFKRFPFLWEHVDTSEISGKPVLNIMVKERTSDVHYRKDPKDRRERVTGWRQDGIDEIADQGGVQALLDETFKELDLYNNDLDLLYNRFVSPMSRIAPDFYKFYLTDTVQVGDEQCIVLSFYPRNQATFGFNGQIFVPVNDSTMFIKKVTMRTPRNINLNFIENLFISQEFERAPDGSRLKKSEDLTIEAKLVSGTPGFYIRHNVAYGGHNFDAPEDMSIFDGMQTVVMADGARNRDTAFWAENRILGVTDNEQRIDLLMARLRKVPIYYWTEKFIKIMFSGYVQTGKDSKFDYGPVNTTFSTNTIEGLRLRAGGMTTANLSKRLFSRDYVAYGTKDRKWKYGVELEYSFIDKEYHSREFPMNAIRLSSSYDIDRIGQHYLFTNQDNMFLSLKRMSDLRVTYRQLNKLEYNLELYNNLSFNLKFQNDRQEATKYVQFVDGWGNDHKHYTETSFSFTIRYAPGEKFYQAKTFRIPIRPEAPIFMLTHEIAPKGFMGSTFMVNKTELSVQKRFWFSAFGFTDVLLKGGHVWSRSAFPNLLIPNANLSYTIQPESYALMNPMEFINDSFASWDITYWLNGALFNYIPVLKQLKLREAVSFKGLWGRLSDRNDPNLHPELFRFPTDAHVTRMTDRPYMELSAGIDNIFKVLRLDYVWRLSYLDVPYPIDRHGLRIAIHATF